MNRLVAMAIFPAPSTRSRPAPGLSRASAVFATKSSRIGSGIVRSWVRSGPETVPQPALGRTADGGQPRMGRYADAVAAIVTGMPDSLGGIRMVIRVVELARI